MLPTVPDGRTTQVHRDHDVPGFVGESELVARAYGVAAEAHSGQRRRDDGSPYITHPIAVARVLNNAGFGEHVLATALLHDVVEDTELSSGEVEARFGPDVAKLVAALSEDEEIEDYEQRKRAHRERVAGAGREAVAIYIADKLSNLRDMRTIYALEGEAIAPRFKAPLELRVRLWRGDAEMASRAAPDLPFLPDFRTELAEFERQRDAGQGAGG
jgi:guanosine-3',5'-bis(diphosphate) 3'-pyrophosphohydrolase